MDDLSEAMGRTYSTHEGVSSASSISVG